MRLMYFGDGIWATKCLQQLLEDGHKILAVILRTDPSDATLSEFAQELDIPIRAPENVNDAEFVGWVQSQKPSLNISMSYDQILRLPIIETAPQGFINCHAGMLPYYRGRNVINWAIINNEKEIGLTVHYVDDGIDTGDIILQRRLPITWTDTYGTLLRKIQDAFPSLLVESVELIDSNQVKRQSQAHLIGTYYSSRVSGDEWIDWCDTSLNIYNKIRAITHPGPGARTLLYDQSLIIWEAQYELSWPKYIATPGEVVGRISCGGVRVKTGDSTLIVKKVQLEGEDKSEHVPNYQIGTRFGVNLINVIYSLRKELAELRKDR